MPDWRTDQVRRLKADEARRRNAQKSTGPKTPEGKAKSRENSSVHGLSGKGVVLSPEVRHAVETRRSEIDARIARDDCVSAQIEDQAALASVRFELSQDVLRRRVREQWDALRRKEAAKLAEQLADHPWVAIELEQTTQGVDWKIERWEFLLERLRNVHQWTSAQRDLAFDLNGVPKMERLPDPRFAWEDHVTLVTLEIERLRRLKSEGLDEMDARERFEAEVGIPHDQSKEAQLYRRYEKENWSKYEKLVKQLLIQPTPGGPPPAPSPIPDPPQGPADPGPEATPVAELKVPPEAAPPPPERTLGDSGMPYRYWKDWPQSRIDRFLKQQAEKKAGQQAEAASRIEAGANLEGSHGRQGSNRLNGPTPTGAPPPNGG